MARAAPGGGDQAAGLYGPRPRTPGAAILTGTAGCSGVDHPAGGPHPSAPDRMLVALAGAEPGWVSERVARWQTAWYPPCLERRKPWRIRHRPGWRPWSRSSARASRRKARWGHWAVAIWRRAIPANSWSTPPP